ncbi:MAG: matrixin family metalloprotease [PVC group bacterium]
MKRAASIVFFLVCVFPAGVFPFTVKTSDEGTFLAWPPGRTTIFYMVGSRGTGSPSGLVGELARAFQSWEEKAQGEVSFIYGGDLENREALQDGVNTVLWVTDGWQYGPDIAAVSTTWPSGETGGIGEVDVEFNGRDFDWTSPGSPGVLETALHEIGHLLGVGHSFNPGAVMHDAVRPSGPVRRVLSRDDIEALLFLYPPLDRKVNRYDLPVLFYPRDFPGEPPILPPSAGLDPGPARWVTALGSADVDKDGYRSEILSSCRDGSGWKAIEGWELPDEATGALRRLFLPGEIAPAGEITAISGVDIDRDGISGEAAVLVRQDGGERLYFFPVDPAAGPAPEPVASLALAAPPANNLIGMASLDADGDRLRDELLVLRARAGGYSLHLHAAPGEGEAIEIPDPGVEIAVPGLQEGARLLGLAVLDADGDGEEKDLVFLELTSSREYWLHAFRLVGLPDRAVFDIAYLTSARLPGGAHTVLPAKMAALDLNRDGYYTELIIFSPAE